MSSGNHLVLFTHREPAGATAAGGTGSGATAVRASTTGGAAAGADVAESVAGGGAKAGVAAAGAVAGLLQHERPQRKRLHNNWSREHHVVSSHTHCCSITAHQLVSS